MVSGDVVFGEREAGALVSGLCECGFRVMGEADAGCEEVGAGV